MIKLIWWLVDDCLKGKGGGWGAHEPQFHYDISSVSFRGSARPHQYAKVESNATSRSRIYTYIYIYISIQVCVFVCLREIPGISQFYGSVETRFEWNIHNELMRHLPPLLNIARRRNLIRNTLLPTHFGCVYVCVYIVLYIYIVCIHRCLSKV